MDFMDSIKQFAARIPAMVDVLPTEEATKNALIMPFFQILGYNVFNPLEFMPEFTADVGIKKGERVDYAIILDGQPAILIEAKWCGEPLNGHDSQLFRYFGTSAAKFAILTNGIVYKFYTDLDEPNKMDLTPFLELDMLNLNDTVINEVKRFSKEKIDIESAFSAASELKYTNLIKALLQQQRTAPDEEFVHYVIGKVQPGVRQTSAVVDRFTPIIKKALNAYINDVINDTLKSAMQGNVEGFEPISENAASENETTEEQENRIITTEEELQAFGIIRALLHDIIPTADITYKDTESYFSILYKGNIRKWICRLKLDGQKKYLIIQDNKYPLASYDDLYALTDALIESAKRFVE